MDHDHSSGMWVPEEPPSWGRMFLPHLDPWSVLPVLALLAGVVYLAGVLRLRGQGVRWPWWRTASFVVGVLSLFAVTGTWLNGYSMELFSVHMAQHMVLSLITPLFLLVGSPVTLALRTLPRGKGTAGAPRALLLEALHSRFARGAPAVPLPRGSVRSASVTGEPTSRNSGVIRDSTMCCAMCTLNSAML